MFYFFGYEVIPQKILSPKYDQIWFFLSTKMSFQYWAHKTNKSEKQIFLDGLDWPVGLQSWVLISFCFDLYVATGIDFLFQIIRNPNVWSRSNFIYSRVKMLMESKLQVLLSWKYNRLLILFKIFAMNPYTYTILHALN